MYRILLVEDDPGIAQAVCAHLRQWELDARCVQNFHTVMEEFTAFDPQLVLLDMLGVYFAKVCGSIGDAEYEEIVEELLALPVKMEAVLEDIDEIKYLASRYFNHNSIFFIWSSF